MDNGLDKTPAISEDALAKLQQTEIAYDDDSAAAGRAADDDEYSRADSDVEEIYDELGEGDSHSGSSGNKKDDKNGSGKAGKRRNPNIGMLVAGIVVVIVLAMIFMRGDELKELAETIRKGSPIFLALGVLAQFGKYFSQGVGFTQCFRAVGDRIRFKTGLGLVFGTFFMNTVAPSFNLAGTSHVMDTASQKGIEVGKGTSAALFMQVCIDSGFVSIMLITFGILSVTVGLQPGWFLLGLFAVVLVGGLVLAMTIGGMKPHLIKKVLRPLVRLADKVLKKFGKGPVDDWIDSTIDQFAGAARHIVGHPLLALRAFLCSLAASTFEILCFVLVGFGFGVFEIVPLICGYVVATLFAMISFTPQGVGIVEAAVMVAFGLFSIDVTAGLAIVMVYRSVVFWMPFLIGAIVIQKNSFRRRKKKDK